MSKWIMIGLILVLACVWALARINPLDNRRNLQVEPFPGLDIKQTICFNNISGIVWKCAPEKVGEHIYLYPNDPKNQIIGIGMSPNCWTCYLIFFRYNDSKNKLESGGIARNIKCKCCRNLFQGEVLQGVLEEILQEASGFLLQQKAFSFSIADF